MAWTELQALRVQASRAESAAAACGLLARHFRLSLDELVELFEDEAWRHAMYGGNRWSGITRKVIEVREALDAGDPVGDLLAAIAATLHNTGRVGDKLQALDAGFEGLTWQLWARPGRRLSSGDMETADQLANLHAFLLEVDRFAQRAHPATFDLHTHAQRLALGLYAATMTEYRGIRALLERRLAPEAQMVARPLLDDSIRLAYMALHRDRLDEVAMQFSWGSSEFERHLAKRAQANGYPWAEEELADLTEEKQEIRAAAEAQGIVLKGLPSSHAMLQELGDPRLSYWHTIASQAIHSSRVGLGMRFAPHPDQQDVTRIELEASLKDVATVGVLSAQVFSFTVIKACEVMGWPNRDDGIRFREEIMDRSARLYESITGVSIVQTDE